MIKTYLGIVNIIGFILYCLNILLYRFSRHKQVNNLLTIISFLGGSLGIIIAILLFDRKFEKDNLESMVETSDKYILKFCNGKKLWANKKYFRPVIIKDNKSHKGIYPTDSAGVKVENKKTRGIIK